jgi:6-phosphogluconolactonase (cycloisomerase 2 family)
MPVSYQITGTVAYGSPVVGQTVEVVDSAGTTCATATTAADGTYSMDTSGCAPGSAGLSVTGYLTPDGAPLLSVAVPPPDKSVIDGVINIDPLTTLLAYDVAGMISSDAPPATSAHVLALLPQVTAAQIQQATTNILSASLLTDLQGIYGVTTTGFSLTSTPFSANGQGLDAFFDAYTLTAPSGGSVQIASAASGLTVSVSLPTGAGSPSTVTSSVSYAIGGNVSGLSGGSLTLTLNGANPLVVTGNGAFTFPATVSTTYAVVVSSQPVGQTCTVSNGSGAGVTANVVNIGVACSVNSYTISGNVSGLGGGKQVVLSNNNADPIALAGNGTFSFSTPVAYNGSYSVTVTTQPTGQICTASHGSGTGVTADVSNVSIECSNTTFSIGGTVSGLVGGSVVTLKNNGGDARTVAANGGFTFATPVTIGSSYSVTIGTQPAAQNCTVTNGTGANIAAAVSNVQIACVSRVAYIYIPNYGSNNVLGYKFNFATGGTTSIPGSPFASGANDRWVTTNPAGTFAYVANQSGNSVSAYTINRATGTLTQVSGSPYATGATPVAIAVNPAGTFAYVTNASSDSVSAFAIDQTTGALTPAAGSPFAAGSNPSKIAINPAGTFAYVTNPNAGTVTALSIDAGTGALTQISGSPFSIGGGNQPQGITVTPAGTVVYATNYQASVAAFSIDAGTGALTPVAGSPFTADATGWGWQSLAVNPAGTFAYVGAGNGTSLLAFSIDPTTGALTQIPSATFGAVGWNYAVFDSTGSKIIISNAWDLTVGVANVNAATGQLTHQAGSPFGVGARPFDIAVVEP